MGKNSEGTPLFSVIIPVFNRSSLICDALDSVRKQSYRPIEVVVIDDGSTDGTGAVVADWFRDNEESGLLSLNYFYQENKGASAARNRGVREVHGVYVQYLDSDDLLQPARFQCLVDAFQETEAEFVQTGFESLDIHTGTLIRSLYGRPDEDQFELALYGWLWANTLRSAFTRELIDRIGLWDESMMCFEDRDYIQRAVARANKAIAIKKVLASARRGEGNQLTNQVKSRQGREWRIQCEERLRADMSCVDNISFEAKQAFASRLYALGLRSNAQGWTDLGERCGKLAESLHVELDKLGRRRRLIWQWGKWGGVFYELAFQLKCKLYKDSHS